MIRIDLNEASPYEAIANIIEKWCKLTGYRDLLVRVSAGGFETTQHLQIDITVDDVHLHDLPSQPLAGENMIRRRSDEFCPHCGRVLRDYEGLRECY